LERFKFLIDCKTDKESENIIKLSDWTDKVAFKAKSIALASAEYIDAPSGSRNNFV